MFFNITVENLFQILSTQIRTKKFFTFKERGVDYIPHLLFVDDVLIFGQANNSMIKAVREALDKFSLFMGMTVNRAKSGIVYSKACSVEIITRLESLINIPAVSFPLNTRDFHSHHGSSGIMNVVCC